MKSMVEKSSKNMILIDNGNIRAIISYVEALKEIRKHLKEGLNKSEKEECCLASVIKDIPREIEKFEKLIRDYCDRNAKVIEKGKCYKIVEAPKSYSTGTNVKFIKVLTRDNKNFVVDKYEFNQYPSTHHISMSYSESCNMNVRNLVNDFYNGLVIEVSEETYSVVAEKYNNSYNDVNDIINYAD